MPPNSYCIVRRWWLCGSRDVFRKPLTWVALCHNPPVFTDEFHLIPFYPASQLPRAYLHRCTHLSREDYTSEKIA